MLKADRHLSSGLQKLKLKGFFLCSYLLLIEFCLTCQDDAGLSDITEGAF